MLGKAICSEVFQWCSILLFEFGSLEIASDVLAKMLEQTQLRRILQDQKQGITAPKSSYTQNVKYHRNKSSGCCYQELNIFCSNQHGRENTEQLPYSFPPSCPVFTPEAGTEQMNTITMVISYFLTI